VDTFGNLKLGAETSDLRVALGDLPWGARLRVSWEGAPQPLVLPWGETFGRVTPGRPLLYEDSYGRLCLAVNQGDAARAFGLQEDVRLSFRLVTGTHGPRASRG
jgi:S-adenosylmethionine hydrolase